ncbi:hypothetical protein Salat_0466000 [Sesamum alatum]|uniref:Uncharacterized protein n=1 Tax=Sesamum alatum TaxID=300844 RepID=A0AAE1Z3G2_9LAMI|nr:hypothetical protein Salat_0466000 [Sesamum alatum]
MPRQSLNVEGKVVARKGKVRKRGCSSSSSSSLTQNYRLKRAFLMGRRGGSTTPVPMWKMMSSKSPSLESAKALTAKDGEKGQGLSVSARKLAAVLWEINGLPSSGVKREILEDKRSEIGNVGKERILESSELSSVESDPVSVRMDKFGSGRRRASAGCRKLLQGDCDLGGVSYLHGFLEQLDQTQNHAQIPCRHVIGLQNFLKDVHFGLKTSKDLLKVLSPSCCLSSTSLIFVSALKVELDRACSRLNKLIQGQKTNRRHIDVLLKQFEEEKVVKEMEERDRIHSAVPSIAGDLEMEKKLRRQTQKLNEKLGRELAETKASLSRATKELQSEKRARQILEQVCDELARGIGEDRAEVEELKRQSQKVREEVEKEREMLQLADLLREERVQMKLSEAKYLFQEKNALVDKLKNELEAYLKSKMGEEQGNGSPSYDKIKGLKQYLRETLNQNDDEENEDVEGEDSADSDFHSIELNINDISKSFQWGNAVQNGSKRNPVEGRKPDSEKPEKPTIPSKRNGWLSECSMNKQENLEVFDCRGSFGFTSYPSKKDMEDEMERYNMIKDLRDHIVSGSRMTLSQDLDSPGTSS